MDLLHRDSPPTLKLIQSKMAVEVRRIRAGEGTLLHDVRLAALADAPAAFGSTFTEEVGRPASAWDGDAAARATGFETANFFAEEDGRVLGMVGAFRPADAVDAVELVSMWVHPDGRGRGLGERLVGAVVDWADAAGAAKVTLWVMRGNDPAIALYTRTGFVSLGPTTHVGHPCDGELRMTLELGGASRA